MHILSNAYTYTPNAIFEHNLKFMKRNESYVVSVRAI